MAKRSPPMPFMCGSTTPRTALAAMAASTACPPRTSICTPACAASGWLAATTPSVVATFDRPAITCTGNGLRCAGRSAHERARPRARLRVARAPALLLRRRSPRHGRRQRCRIDVAARAVGADRPRAEAEVLLVHVVLAAGVLVELLVRRPEHPRPGVGERTGV